MTTWVDKSDNKSRFLDGGESSATTTIEALSDLLACLRSEIIGKGTATDFDLLLFEVNCDTGRLLAAATSSDQHASGKVDGCSLRVQEVQNFWYDLLESRPSDEQFSAGLSEQVRELGMAFRERFIPYLEEFKRSCSSEGFVYRVFGSDPGVPVYEETFDMT